MEDHVFVFILIAIVSILFASNRIRLDIISILTVLALMISGTLTVEETLTGFGNPVVIMVAGLLVISEMLDRTGVTQSIGALILRFGGKNEALLLVFIMLTAALLGSVMSSTAVVALLIPIVLKISAKTNLNKSRLLMPMADAALISGMLTLIASAPNLVVSEELASAGFKPLNFFSFTPIGIAVLIAGLIYMLTLGRRLLPNRKEMLATIVERSMDELAQEFGIHEKLGMVQISDSSSLIGQNLLEADLSNQYNIRLLSVSHSRKSTSVINCVAGNAEVEFQKNDILFAFGEKQDMQRFMESKNLSPVIQSDKENRQYLQEIGSATIMIHPDSNMQGKSIRESSFRSLFNVHVLGIKRGQEVVTDFEDEPLQVADVLLASGSWEKLNNLRQRNHDYIFLDMPVEFEDIAPARKKAPIALSIFGGMILLSVFNVVPLVTAILIAVVLAIFTRCLTMEEAYRSIHWSSVVLIAGMFPLADALQKTGGIDLIVTALTSTINVSSPYLVMSILFLITAVLGLFLSNTASAVLMAPVAIGLAAVTGVSPYSYAIAVMIAASAAFITPVSTPVVTLVVQPGNYRFNDFVKVGVPLLIIVYLITLFLGPVIFPFNLP